MGACAGTYAARAQRTSWAPRCAVRAGALTRHRRRVPGRYVTWAVACGGPDLYTVLSLTVGRDRTNRLDTFSTILVCDTGYFPGRGSILCACISHSQKV